MLFSLACARTRQSKVSNFIFLSHLLGQCLMGLLCVSCCVPLVPLGPSYDSLVSLSCSLRTLLTYLTAPSGLPYVPSEPS